MAESLEDVISVDGRLLRSLRLLITRPGFLTAEWRRGRRASYIRPLRLYLLTALVYFLLWPFVVGEGRSVLHPFLSGVYDGAADAGWEADEPSGAQEPIGEVGIEDPATAPPQGEEGSEYLSSSQAEETADRIMRILPRVVIVALVPAFGALVMLLFRAQAGFYVEHLVFGLHFHSFVFLLAVPLALVFPFLGSNDRWDGIPHLILLLGALGYLYLSARRVYGVGRLRAVMRSLIVLVGYALILLVSIVVLTVWAAFPVLVN
jgi:hypothetical protein